MSVTLPAIYNKLTRLQKIRVREEYIKLQDGNCFWCKESLKLPPPINIQSTEINLNLFPPNMLKYPIHLQHDHSTGLTEGAVHARCNCVMWQYYNR